VRRRTSLSKLFFVNLALTLGLSEITCRVFDLDIYLIKPLLYYQCADLDVHKQSDNAELLFELKPEAKFVYESPERTPMVTVAINRFGMRDRSRSERKAPGVFRIICLGGSNTYGALVSDDETYPAVLEKKLNKNFEGRFEVWNGGVSAYVLSQKVELAKLLIERYDPDLLIFQHKNIGRRAFLWGEDPEKHFRRNPALFKENLCNIPFERSSVGSILFRFSALTRTLIIILNRFTGNSCEPSKNDYDLNIKSFIDFYNEYRSQISMVMMEVCGVENCVSSNTFHDRDIPLIDLWGRSRLPQAVGPEYFEAHPPPHVYDWYAEIIMEDLVKLGLIRSERR